MNGFRLFHDRAAPKKENIAAISSAVCRAREKVSDEFLFDRTHAF